MRATHFPAIKNTLSLHLTWRERLRAVFTGFVHIHHQVRGRAVYPEDGLDNATFTTDTAIWSKGEPEPKDVVANDHVEARCMPVAPWPVVTMKGELSREGHSNFGVPELPETGSRDLYRKLDLDSFAEHIVDILAVAQERNLSIAGWTNLGVIRRETNHAGDIVCGGQPMPKTVMGGPTIPDLVCGGK